MSLQETGKLIAKFDTEIISDKFQKREFVIEKKEQVGQKTFTDYIKFKLVQDKVNIIDSFSIGDMITVSFNLRGRKWSDGDKISYFTNLEAWSIVKDGTHQRTI